MSSNSLSKHKKSDMVKWIITFIVLIALVASVAILGVKLSQQITTKTLNASAYEIGALNESGKKITSKTDIRTKNFVDVDGLKVEIGEDATVTYKLFFYDKDETFISASASQSKNYTESVPVTAKYFKIVITPTDDDEITSIEKSGYVKQVTVTVNK